MWLQLPFLRAAYGDVSALKVLAAAVAFHRKLRALPLCVASSPIAVAAVLSIGVALGADAVVQYDAELAELGQAGGDRQASRAPVQQLAGPQEVERVRSFEASLIRAAYGAR